ncbi:MAG TPA: PAS domain-containing sensor histidine kinase [Gammaproteobacteria bacterium]
MLQQQGLVFKHYLRNNQLTEINYVSQLSQKDSSAYISYHACTDDKIDHQMQQQFGIHSLLQLPVVYGHDDHHNGLSGCLQLHNLSRGKCFNPQDIEQLSGLVAAASAALYTALHLPEDSDHLQQQHSEPRYRELVESTSDWIWEVDHQGVYTYVSPGVTQLLGYQPDEVLGRTPFDFMPREEAQRVQQIFQQQYASQQKAFDGLININLHKNGQQVVLETSGIPVNDEDGNLQGYRGIDRDITQRVKIDQKLLRAKQEAEYASHAKSEFLSHMSHELRTPLNAILGFAQILDMNAHKFDQQHQQNIREIMHAGDHLLNLINDVLDLAKIESGRLDLHIESVDVCMLIKQCLSLIHGQARRRGIELVECQPQDAFVCHDFHVVADLIRLKQVFLNILSNAVKYNRDNGHISVSLQPLDQQRLRIHFTDTGHGLSADEIAQLFTPYHRLKANNKIEGAGIGLVITRQLIELMGGELSIESLPGEGSVFSVTLDLATE